MTASPAAQAQDGSDGDVYPLPASWQGDATVGVDAIPTVAPPFQALDASGDFRITYLPADGGDVIRILPDGQNGAPGQSVTMAWPIAGDGDGPDLTPGSVFTLSASARAFSPPDGVMLTIREYDGESWSSSSVPMQEVSWTDYFVTRQIGEGVVEAQIGLEWTLPNENAWLEFRSMELAVSAPAEGTPSDLSPTDTPTPLVTPTPSSSDSAARARPGILIVVTSTPTPPNVFAAATWVAAATEWAAVLGTATPTPGNMVTATPTPSPLVVTDTPTPANEATATYDAAVATAMAATTGTSTPLPDGVVALVATATPTGTPVPKTPSTSPATPKSSASKTATPVYVLVDDLFFPTSTPTPEFPQELVGKILFLSDYLANNSRTPNAFMINPDGTGLALLTSREFYDRAKERDAYSADKRLYAYSIREPLGSRTARIQVFYDDAEYGSTQHQLTYFGAGTAWAPAWSPRQEAAALVSSESKNDEIWLVRRNEWPPMQLTTNDWEWDRSPSFSPDGATIAFESNRVTGTRQIWLMDASGQNQRQITNFPFEASEPVWVKYTDQ